MEYRLKVAVYYRLQHYTYIWRRYTEFTDWLHTDDGTTQRVTGDTTEEVPVGAKRRSTK